MIDLRIRGTTPERQIRDFQRRMEAIGAGYVRGVVYSYNGMAKEAHGALTRVIDRDVDQPIPFTKRALGYKTTPLTTQNLRAIETSVFVKDDQSTYLKYAFGDRPQARQPGDVGPSDQHIYVPQWPALQRHGINPTGGSNLPRSALKKLARQAGSPAGRTRAARSKPTIFFGAPTIKGRQRPLGYWSRPAYVPGQRRAAPSLLVLAADEAIYQPFLQQPWEDISQRVMATLPARLEQELREKLWHQLGRTPSPRVNDFLTGI